MNPLDWLNIIDRLDVPTLGVLTVYGFWRVVRLMNSIEQRLAVADEKRQAMADNLERHTAQLSMHAERDHSEHQRLHERIDSVLEKVAS